MMYVPDRFQKRHPFKYPHDNKIPFEEWYFDNHDFQEEGRKYLPIFFTGYYVRASFGQDLYKINELQKFIDKLDKTQKYYCLIQYDNGIINDVSGIDLMVFSMSGGLAHYPLPLISTAHEVASNQNKRDLYTNFVGKITHPLREQVISGLRGRPNNYISTQHHSLFDYCNILQRSVFTLCTRGFGPTSFRIQEALQYGSIPVYISDEWVIPHNIPFTTYGVLIDAAYAHRVDDILKSISPEEIKRKQEAIPEVYKRYYTYEGCRDMIKLNLKNPAKERVTEIPKVV